jgi:hypothetical protein
MKHYGIAQWVDFARGIAPETSRDAMRNHLTEGCSECGEMADFCRKLQVVSMQAASHPAPEWVVRSAKAIFPVEAQPRRTRTMRLAIELIYDSFLLPAPSGLRSSWQVGWQALYRAGDCSVDLRIEPELASSRAAVIGQVSNHLLPDERLEGVPVCLKLGKLVVAETRSNRFGEFLIEYEQQDRLRLWVYLEDRSKHFQLPLKKLTSDHDVGRTN